MDFNHLPPEVHEKIFSFLSYRELKLASLVCRRWYQVSEASIIRNGRLRINVVAPSETKEKNLISRYLSWLMPASSGDGPCTVSISSNTIRNALRNYNTILIHAYDSKIWERVEDSAQKPSEAEEPCYDDLLQHYLDFFSSTCYGLKDHFEKIHSFDLELNRRDEQLCLRAFRVICASTSAPVGMLNLRKIFENLATLEVLELRNLNLTGTNYVYAEHLEELSLEDVALKDDTLFISAPNLVKCSLSADDLDKVRFTSNTKFTQLCVFLPTINFNDRLKNHVCRFIQASHGAVESLILVRSYNIGRDIVPNYQDAVYERVMLDVSHLELHLLDLNMDFFAMISEWNSLQSLTLVNCVMYYDETSRPITLPTIQRMVLDGVVLMDTDDIEDIITIGGEMFETEPVRREECIDEEVPEAIPLWL